MKQIIIVVLSLLILSCNQSRYREQELQNQIDDLQSKIDNMYQPGFGDYMGSIQNHHDKLWFAGINENWELATFQMHEIEEIFNDIQTSYPDRKETQSISIIEPSLEAMDKAISERDNEGFKKGYISLTNACNSCHQATNHEFIRIKTPTTPSFSNQEFK
jgi:hypothetical protein